MYVRKCTTFISKITKKVSIDISWVHTERFLSKFLSHKCTVYSKSKVSISCKKLYSMHLRHLVNTDQTILTFQENSIAVPWIFVSTDIRKQESKFMSKIIKWL